MFAVHRSPLQLGWVDAMDREFTGLHEVMMRENEKQMMMKGQVSEFCIRKMF